MLYADSDVKLKAGRVKERKQNIRFMVLTWHEKGGPSILMSKIAMALEIGRTSQLRIISSNLFFPLNYIQKILLSIILLVRESRGYEVVILDGIGYAWIMATFAKLLGKRIVQLYVGNYPEEFRTNLIPNIAFGWAALRLAQLLVPFDEFVTLRLADLAISTQSELTRYLRGKSTRNNIVEWENLALVDTEKFRPMPEIRSRMRKHLGFKEGDFVMLHFVGIDGLSSRENVDKSLRIITDLKALCPRAYLVYIGTGPMEATIRRVVQHDSHVRFLGKIPHEQIPSYLQIADVGLDLRTPPGAGIGNTVPELLSCGVPIVVFNMPPIDRVITDSLNGCLVSNIAEMKATLIKLYQSAETTTCLKKNARESAILHFSYSNFRTHLYKLLFTHRGTRVVA